VPFPRHTLAEADALVAAAGFDSTSVDAAERCVDCRRMTRRMIVGGAFYCSAPTHVRRAIEVARFHADRAAAPVVDAEEAVEESAAVTPRISTREELIARQVANGVSPERAAIVTVEQLVADTLNLGYATVAAYLAAPGREVGQVTPWTLDRAERAFAREVESRRLHDDPAPATDGLVHLMSDTLLDACGTAGPGGLHLAPSTTPERITCPACLPLVEADVPPTADERVTVPVRASELRPGDLVVDSLGEVQYAAFDTDAPGTPGNPQQVLVWTAIRDQERGLPPVIRLRPERELLVLRLVSAEGRELLAALDRA
jgi:hypothetical protein